MSRLLLTNDDGIASLGIRDLAVALAADHEVVVAAPAEDVSGAGTSMGRYDLDDRTRVRPVELAGLEAYALTGPPGLCVLAGALGAFGPPFDLVVSGINAGMNTGTSIIHSGTVGGALTARTFGTSGIAVSVAEQAPWRFDTAVPIARAAAGWVSGQEGVVTLNVNVPVGGPDAVRGARWTHLDAFGHFRVASLDPSGEVLDLEVHDRRAGAEPGSDTACCLDGYVALTLLAGLEPAPAPSVDPGVVVARR